MAIYYVSPSGSDSSGTGATGTPWKTIQGAINKGAVGSGDTIRVRTGTYEEAVTINKSITLEADTGHSPVIDGRYDPVEVKGYIDSGQHKKYHVSESPVGSTWVVFGQFVSLVSITANNVTLDGFTIKNACGRHLGISSNDVLVNNCILDFSGTGGISIGESANRVTVQNSRVTRVSQGIFYLAENGIKVNGRPGQVTTSVIVQGHDCIVQDCIIGFVYGEGLTAARNSERAILRRNKIIGCGHYHLASNRGKDSKLYDNIVIFPDRLDEFNPRSKPNSASAGILIGDENNKDQATTCQGTKVYNNLVVGACPAFEATTDALDTRRDNPQVNSSDIYVGFNTFVGGPISDRAFFIHQTHGGWANGIIENNLFYKGRHTNSGFGGASKAANLRCRNNAWYGLDPSGRGFDSSADVTANPLLVNPNASITVPSYNPWSATIPNPWTAISGFNVNNYKLLQGSPVRNKAATNYPFNGQTPPAVTTDNYFMGGTSRGSSKDLGAHEYDGAVVDPGNNLSASFTQSATSGSAPTNITFTDTSTSTGGTITERYWQFGDGTDSTSTNPSHIYSTAGVYVPTLRVRDSNGLEATVTGSTITITQPNVGGAAGGNYDLKRFTAPTTTGDFTVTFDHLDGAVPVGVILAMVNATAVGTVTDNAMMSIGYSSGGSGGSQNFSWAARSGDNLATSSANNYMAGGGCLTSLGADGNPDGRLHVKSFGSNSITFTCSDAFPAAYQCVAFAISGEGVKTAVPLVGTSYLGAAGSISPMATPQGVPDVVMMLHAFSSLSVSPIADLDVSLGFANRDAQYSYMWHEDDNVPDTYLQAWTSGEGTVARALPRNDARVAIRNMNSVEVSGGDLNHYNLNYQIVLPEGTATTVQQQTSPAATGTRSYALGYTPGGAIFWGGLNKGSNTNSFYNQNGSAFWIGFVTPNDSAFFCMTAKNRAATSDTQTWTGSDLEVYRGGNTKALDGTVALTSNGYNINWTTTEEITFNVVAFEQGELGTPNPVVAFTVFPANGGYETDAHTFTSTTNANGNTITGLVFDFGDNHTSTSSPAVHFYDAPGDYIVTLTVTVTGGATFSHSETITVLPEFSEENYIIGPWQPHPQGVNYDTPNYVGLDPDGELPGYLSFKLTAGETRYDAAPEDITSPVPGMVRMVYDDVEEDFKFIRPDGSYQYMGLGAWTGGGGSGATPPSAPVLSAISNGDGDGDYTVSWGAVSGADSYTLQQKLDSGSFATVYSGASLSKAFVGNAPGTYTYRVSATDGDLTSEWSSTVSTTVSSGSTEVTLTPSASNHDAWEGGGTVTLNDNSLILTAGTRWAGLYVNGSSIPQGSTIESAILRYKANSTNYDDPNITWYGHDVDTAGVFTTVTNNISSRTLTTASVLDKATGIGVTNYREVNITSVVQEIVDRPGWTGPIAIIGDCESATFTCNLRPYAYDNGSDYWQLVVTYS